MRKIKVADLSWRRTFQGAWEISAVVDGHYVSRQFMGYSKREASRLFRDHFNNGGK